VTPLLGRHDDRAVGLIGTVAGVLVFLVFLLFALQLLIGLHTTSTVTAVAHDAARRAAARGALRDADALRAYEHDARSQLGRVGDPSAAVFDWRLVDPERDGNLDFVELTITLLDPPHLLPPRFGGLLGFERVEETVRVRVERFQE
jgi:hypothetical protein